ncbi:hypothetical protein OZN62_05040 [Aurantiacibacter sp. MUD11]|uniref:hypothetical protein n=1 Tax=Aurantiacibacter sp. MUD11 TaxID=3003265 RepID=UPI0022AA008B|nr:hypothetical protein [Aurantiacibacter sp. MUD11]WAT18940.1 hypothetical protein OZN62_05040 [Aurantiacibacter sp. MUD11]
MDKAAANRSFQEQYPAPGGLLLRKSRELARYARSLAPARRACVILAQGRTGTWLLHSLLNDHPETHFDKEILQQRVWLPVPYVLGCSSAAGDRVYGCHVQPNQLESVQNFATARFVDALAQRGWSIIHVTRRDIVRQSISAIVALQRRLWVSDPSEAVPQQMLTIDVDQVIARIHRRKEHLAIERSALSAHPHLSLVYEDDLEDAARHQATADRIFDFLGLERRKVSAGTQRLLSRDLREVIINYDDMIAQLRDVFPQDFDR